jgi:hypothetical protein
METIVESAQELVYSLLSLMQARVSKSQSQRPVWAIPRSPWAYLTPKHSSEISQFALADF